MVTPFLVVIVSTKRKDPGSRTRNAVAQLADGPFADLARHPDRVFPAAERVTALHPFIHPAAVRRKLRCATVICRHSLKRPCLWGEQCHKCRWSDSIVRFSRRWSI